MNKGVLTGILIGFLLGAGGNLPAASQSDASAFSHMLSSNPLEFTPNCGQWPDSIKFRAGRGTTAMWIMADGIGYQFSRRHDGTAGQGLSSSTAHRPDRNNFASGDSVEVLVIKSTFEGANHCLQVRGEKPGSHRSNFFIGADPAKWRINVSAYEVVTYSDIYPGVDLRYYGNGRQMEYDFVVSPGADYTKIRIRYDGARSVCIDADGNLVIETDLGNLTEKAPVIYQMSGDKRISLSGSYSTYGANSIGFALTSDYDRSLPVVIDPVLTFSTYLGGNSDDCGLATAVDASGSMYITGYTSSSNFPLVGSYQGTNHGGFNDAFITKLAADGSGLIYSTYLGGSGEDRATAITLGPSGTVYIAGHNSSNNFPMINAYQSIYGGGYDAYIAKISANGDSLLYSTYLGGNGLDVAQGVVLDTAGAIYVTGTTQSANFPIKGAFQPGFGGLQNAFVTKFKPSGDSLAYSTYLGGTHLDWGNGIAVDSTGAAYVAGETGSGDFPVLAAYQSTKSTGYDAFVTKLKPAGDSLAYSTFLGGSSPDHGFGVAIDKSGSAYVTGYTESADFPTYRAIQSISHTFTRDIFVTKLSAGGDSLQFSTYLGGSGDDYGWGIQVGRDGSAYIIGESESWDIPHVDAYQANPHGLKDVFVAMFTAAGDSLAYGTFLGGSNIDRGYGITVDSAGSAYITGTTASNNFPMANAFQGTFQVYYDAFAAKLAKVLTSVESDTRGELPITFAVSQNYPNPFNPVTTIEYGLPSRSDVTVEIFNMVGQRVRLLESGSKSAGSHRIQWNGQDEAGSQVASGVYLYRIQAGSYVDMKKMTLLK